MSFYQYTLTTNEIEIIRSMEQSEKKRLATSLGNFYLFVMFYFARSFRKLSEIMEFEGVSDL
ncbi:hypothetical protein CEQ90_13360 [Lewinellaceae bacterium SD302]|nr:hypothetical protein CEQ90_13360 [Lewinellaceae bacterium SD302]